MRWTIVKSVEPDQDMLAEKSGNGIKPIPPPPPALGDRAIEASIF